MSDFTRELFDQFFIVCRPDEGKTLLMIMLPTTTTLSWYLLPYSMIRAITQSISPILQPKPVMKKQSYASSAIRTILPVGSGHQRNFSSSAKFAWQTTFGSYPMKSTAICCATARFIHPWPNCFRRQTGLSPAWRPAKRSIWPA